MKPISSLFTEHPASVGETYGQHLLSAAGFSLQMIGAGIACLVHALLPCLFVRSGSNAIARLHDRMILNRTRQPLAGQPLAGRPAISPGTYRSNSKALPTS